MTQPRVLVACEFSGIVRDAFAAVGCDAWSCDLLPTERPGPHYQADALFVSRERPWDLLIAHPPCTYLCNSGVRWLYGGKGKVQDPERWRLMHNATVFFRALLNAPIPRVAVENPVPHSHAGLPKFTQSIQPWQFGHGEVKRTCLWLRGLPPLVPANIVTGREPRVHHASPSADRWKERSRTYHGIAAAMAAQWAPLLHKPAPESAPSP